MYKKNAKKNRFNQNFIFEKEKKKLKTEEKK